MEITGKNYIGFESSSQGSDTFRAFNPENLEPLETEFFEATESEIDTALKKAEKAYQSYKNKSADERAGFLEAIGEEILALGDQLIQRCMAETGLPEARLTGERMRTVNQLRLFAEVVREGSWVDARIDTAIPDRKPLPKPDIRQMQVPLGPVGIFGASNFPLAFSVAGGDTASALAAGCPIVVKGHPLHPGTSELVASAILAAAGKTGMPDGVFSLVQGQSVAVGMAIVQHPLTSAIGFTGSFRGGKAIFDAANQREKPIPVFAEMGSSNPVFVLPGAAKERNKEIAKGLVGSVNLGVGQFCTNPGLVITGQSSATADMVKAMKELVDDTASGTMLAENIKNNYESGIARLRDGGKVELLASGKLENGGAAVQSRFFRTSGENFLRHTDLADEVFGPSTLNVQADSKEQMLSIAKSLEGHLTATIHGTEEDLEEYSELVQVLERKVGRLIFNGYPTGVEVCHSMVHGGPYPATTNSQSTSVGTAAIKRFSRPICYQDFPQDALPAELKDNNPLNIWRMVNGKLSKE
jgi:alpha-ketoglutaric semialdehyde dehydrogenase